MVDANLNHLQKDLLLTEDLNKTVTSAEEVFSHPVICNNEGNIETNNNENYEDKGVEMDGTHLEMNINSEQINQESNDHKNEYNNNSNNTYDYNDINDNNNNDIIPPTVLNIFKYESLCNAFHNDFNGCVDTDAWNQNSNNISCSGLNSYVLSEYCTTEPLSCDVQNNIMPDFFNGLECETDKYGDMKDNQPNDEYVDNGTGHCAKSFECVENSYLESFKAFIEELKNGDKEADEIASVSSISEHCSGYQSSDFEFIDEDEAKKAAFVTKRISSIETMAKNINSDFKFNDECDAKMKVFHTNEIHTMENREETNSYNPDAQNDISFNNLEASSSRNFMYNRNTIHNTSYQENLFNTYKNPTVENREVTNSFNPDAQNMISFNNLKASSSRNFMYNRNTIHNTSYQENLFNTYKNPTVENREGTNSFNPDAQNAISFNNSEASSSRNFMYNRSTIHNTPYQENLFDTYKIPTVENREGTNSFNPDALNTISFNNLEASSSRNFMYNRNTIHNTSYQENLFNTYKNPTVENREVTNSFNPDAQNMISFNNLKASSSRNFMYNRNTINNTSYQDNLFNTYKNPTVENREVTSSFNPDAQNTISFNNSEASSSRNLMYNRSIIHNTAYRGNLFDTNQIPTMNTREVTNSFNPDAQNAISFNYLKASSSRNFMYNRNTFRNTAYQENVNYQQNHVIPEGEDFLNLFQGAHVPAYELRFYENKSIFARNPTSTVKHIGFDIRMLLEGHKQYISENEVREAKQSEDKILSLYPEHNRQYRRKM